MSPETGQMRQPTIRQEAELLTDQMLLIQSQLNERIAGLKRQEFGRLRQEIGLSAPDQEQAVWNQLTNVRVKAVRHGIEVDALKNTLVPSVRSAETVVNGRIALSRILDGTDDRLLVIAGPCSIHDPEEALIYADWLAGQRRKFGDRLELVMRTYLEKPRSELGWKGLVNDPNLDNTTNISLGLTIGRMLLCQITNKGVPTALERVDARTTQYFDDLSVYDAIGARDSQTNRARVYLSVTSAVGGVKNPTDGNLMVPVQAVTTARAEHTYIGDDEHGLLAEIESTGNETVHVILRGGDDGPNYSARHVQEVKRHLSSRGLTEAVVIDASHGNSRKIAANQAVVVEDVARQMLLGETAIKGIMIESNLRPGTQKLVPNQPLEYGVSITDECIGLDQTAEMFEILAAATEGRRTLVSAGKDQL